MGAPSSPPATTSASARNTGADRSTRPTWAGTPADATMAASASAPARSGARGFSQNTARPRATAASTTAWWAVVGVHTHTASHPATTSGTLRSARAPLIEAKPSARASSRS